MTEEEKRNTNAENPDTAESRPEHTGENHSEENASHKTSPSSPRLADFVWKFPEDGGRVCITYGRDQIMNRQVVSLIKELGIDPIVMQDKTNSRKPLAEFVTEHKDIAFVIAILSADDWAYPKSQKPQDALLYADQKVVYHLGYWIGKLGRQRVFALYYDQRSFRWPTEHFDVIYTPLDRNDAWKKELIKRLKDCAIQFTHTKT